MGSAAFGNVARAALGFAYDTEADDGTCIISQVKNNLGRLDLPSLRYRIEEATIDTPEGPASVGRLVLLGETGRSVAAILGDRQTAEERSALQMAKDFLTEALGDRVGHLSKEVVQDARDGHAIAEKTLRRAKNDLPIEVYQEGREWYWKLPSDGQIATDRPPRQGLAI
jgi:hypothetical protein